MRIPKRIVALVSLLAAVALLVGACGEGDPTSAPAPTNTPVPPAPTSPPQPEPTEAMPEPTATAAPLPTATPIPTATSVPQPTADARRGGEFIGVQFASPADFDPIAARSVEFFHSIGQAYNQLVQYNFEEPVDAIIPDLAESWEVEGGSVYTFTLRQGLAWHDGTPLVAEDVAWAVEKLKEVPGQRRGEFESLESVEAVDEQTVRMTLVKPRTSWLAVLGLYTGPIAPRHIYEQLDGDLTVGPVIGTGPFIFRDFEQDQFIEMVRNDRYYDPALPYLDSIRVLIIADEATRLAAFRAGRVHTLWIGATWVDKPQVEDLQRSVPDLSPNEHEAMQAKVILVNTNTPPFDDVRVRRAMFLAVDRWAALQVLLDTVRPAGPVVPPNWAIPDEELFQLPGYRQGADKEQDREEARALLAEAGYPDGFDTELFTISDLQRHVNLSVFIIDQLKTVGINVENKLLPVAEWLPVFTQTFDFPLITVEANVQYPDPDSAAGNIMPGIWTHLEDQQMSDLFNSQSNETDPAARRAIVKDLQFRMIEVVNMVPIAWFNDYYPTQPEVEGFVAPLGVWSRHRLDRVWLEG